MKRRMALAAAKSTIWNEQLRFWMAYQSTVVSVKALGYSEEEAIEIAEEAVNDNAVVLREEHNDFSNSNPEIISALAEMGEFLDSIE